MIISPKLSTPLWTSQLGQVGLPQGETQLAITPQQLHASQNGLVAFLVQDG